jgi:hypothetical protein
MMMILRIGIGIGIAVGVAGLVALVIRLWQLRRGTTDAEVRRSRSGA